MLIKPIVGIVFTLASQRPLCFWLVCLFANETLCADTGEMLKIIAFITGA
jgi:hypothetical protein